jgi:hypothetical protein
MEMSPTLAIASVLLVSVAFVSVTLFGNGRLAERVQVSAVGYQIWKSRVDWLFRIRQSVSSFWQLTAWGYSVRWSRLRHHASSRLLQRHDICWTSLTHSSVRL